MPTDSTTPTRLAALYARLPEAVRTGYWTRVVPVLAMLAVATHIPSFLRPVWSPDEGYLASEARMLADGGVLYDTVVDRKPPLLPWLYEACFSVFGSLSLWPLRTLAIVAHLVTAILLASIARGRWGNRAGAAAGGLYLLLSIGLSPEDTQAATFEVFMLPAMVAAFRYAERRRWLAAGIAVAICSLTKQTGGAVMLPVLWMLFQDARLRGVRWGPALLKIWFGFAVPIALVAVILTKPKGFLFWVVTGSGDYASLGGGAWWQMIGRALGNSAILAAAGLGFLLPLGRRIWLRYRVGRELPKAGKARGSTSDLWIWLFSSVVAVAVGFHFFGHYYLQLMPPLVLLGVGAVSVSAISWRPVLAYSAVASAAFWVLAVAWPGEQMSQTTQVATAVAARSTPKDTVLVWGMHPELYWLSDRRPASRYLTAGFLTNFSGGKGSADVGEQYSVTDAWQIFDQELDKGLPEIVVDDSGNAPYQPTLVPKIENLLDSHYEVVGAYGDTMVYRLRK